MVPSHGLVRERSALFLQRHDDSAPSPDEFQPRLALGIQVEGSALLLVVLLERDLDVDDEGAVVGDEGAIAGPVVGDGKGDPLDALGVLDEQVVNDAVVGGVLVEAGVRVLVAVVAVLGDDAVDVVQLAGEDLVGLAVGGGVEVAAQEDGRGAVGPLVGEVDDEVRGLDLGDLALVVVVGAHEDEVGARLDVLELADGDDAGKAGVPALGAGRVGRLAEPVRLVVQQLPDGRLVEDGRHLAGLGTVVTADADVVPVVLAEAVPQVFGLLVESLLEAHEGAGTACGLVVELGSHQGETIGPGLLLGFELGSSIANVVGHEPKVEGVGNGRAGGENSRQ